MIARAWEERMRNDSNVLEVSFWGDENVPEILSGDG